MDRNAFIKIIDTNLKLIRNESNFTQDKMAETIGISKKTLVQIEKERASLGWMGAVAVASIFKNSKIMQMNFGGDVEDIILSLAFKKYELDYENTLGGKVWWRDVEKCNNYKIQQNIISNHYRILNEQNKRISSSFDLDYMKKRLAELANI
ncbi:DNA-binding transcriptional regulator, XRE-family HTH domain [Desulfonispora thiosulfatigenes DSM 11270]|uniref:DNA-binding transcriptional regulator, XRE-family HTH domain n=1 Tax=Desulfonispora thiosulfatigenes DSM 11270 TaxID=656914 RepID=A0A1W1UED9_DESTI|nr:helix-turn-helix domain-containing protein [Desulfonispora thiosulfatigenes]SMB79475.1 DNA-binding transcriptional regulator, XRE-family HTH domain [Desulfonispora thiosulfatigenes DSM 11270]